VEPEMTTRSISVPSTYVAQSISDETTIQMTQSTHAAVVNTTEEFIEATTITDEPTTRRAFTNQQTTRVRPTRNPPTSHQSISVPSTDIAQSIGDGTSTMIRILSTINANTIEEATISTQFSGQYAANDESTNLVQATTTAFPFTMGFTAPETTTRSSATSFENKQINFFTLVIFFSMSLLLIHLTFVAQ